MPNNASTKYGSRCQSEKQCAGTSRHSDGTRSHDARRAEPALLHDAWCRATAAKRHPDGQRDDGLTRDGRVTARRERIFYWKSSHHGEILNLVSKMLPKTWSYKCFVLGLSIHLTFSTVFSTLKPIFLHDDLISSKKSIYMKNAEEQARFEIFL